MRLRIIAIVLALSAFGAWAAPAFRDRRHRLGKLVVSRSTLGAGAKLASGSKIALKLSQAPKPKAKAKKRRQSRAVRRALRAAAPQAHG